MISDKPKWENSKFPMLREIMLGEIIETVVSNKGSQCKSDDFMVEVDTLIEIRVKECRALVMNTLSVLIDEVRKYE